MSVGTAQPPNGRGRERGAFTLIELLVVTAIISILASMLMPAFATALRRVRATVCANNMPRWYMSIESYADDYNSLYPGVVMWGQNDRFTTNIGGAQVWAQAMMVSFGTYLDTSAVKCPARREDRHPGACDWPMRNTYYYWNPIDYVVHFGMADRTATDPLNDGNGWTSSYWGGLKSRSYGPVGNRNQSYRPNTPILFDRIWTPSNPNIYFYYPQYNSISNHNASDRWAEGGNILCLDGSYQYWFTNGEVWVAYSHDYYCDYWMPREIFVQ